MGLRIGQGPRSLRGLLLVAAALSAEPGLADVQNRQVEFNRDVRPILSDYCYTCHGPDKANRKTALRFDTQEGAFADLGGHRAIVPGDLAKSEMIRRITAADEAVRMPPVYSGRTLTAQQIDLLSRWVEQGAQWQKHWSF